jgi:hypothetical protein
MRRMKRFNGRVVITLISAVSVGALSALVTVAPADATPTTPVPFAPEQGSWSST